jgi:hypothetical protein
LKIRRVLGGRTFCGELTSLKKRPKKEKSGKMAAALEKSWIFLRQRIARIVVEVKTNRI